MEKKQSLEELLNDQPTLTLEEFCHLCRVDEDYIIELVEVGIIDPVGHKKTNWYFSSLHMLRLKKAQRLQRDLKLNLPGVALSLELLDEIKELRDYVQDLEHQLRLLTLL